MSSQARTEIETIDSDQPIIDYLSKHPDFLSRHPELLENLEIPHDAGGASLLEYQVSVLRDKNRRHVQRLLDYHEVAEDNATLLACIHDLYIIMLDAADSSALIKSVTTTLCQEFGCDSAAIGLYAGPVPEGAIDLTGAKPRAAFEGLRKNPQPAVGRLARNKLEWLFGDQAGDYKSVALTPLDEDGEVGLLVLASVDEHTYHPGMGTLFIHLLGRMLGESLKRLEHS